MARAIALDLKPAAGAAHTVRTVLYALSTFFPLYALCLSTFFSAFRLPPAPFPVQLWEVFWKPGEEGRAICKPAGLPAFSFIAWELELEGVCRGIIPTTSWLAPRSFQHIFPAARQPSRRLQPSCRTHACPHNRLPAEEMCTRQENATAANLHTKRLNGR